MENHSNSEIIGSLSAPYINSLASSGALATNYDAVAHPSLPNYLALTGATTFGITSDCTTCWISAPSIADTLESSGSTWTAYQESMPYACYVGDSYPYVQKHDPFIYYNDIRTNPSRCQSHVVPYSQLATDLQSTSTTPSFSFITPNACNDMHDCSVATGDAWLQQQVPAILNSPAFTTQHSLLALTWDEDDFTSTNQVATIFVGSYVKPGSTSATGYNHYSLVRTIEAARGLSTLTSNDAAAAPMSDMFATSNASLNACITTQLAPSLVSPQQVGATISLTASSTGCPNPLYEFWVLAPGATQYTLARQYSTSATFSWSTSGAVSGTYRINVWARDASSQGTYSNGFGSWDAYNASLTYTLTDPPPAGSCTAVSDSALPARGAMIGLTATFTTVAIGCGTPQYEFWILSPGAGLYALAQPYSSNATLTWNTASNGPGVYRINVWVRDASSSGAHSNAWGSWDAYDASVTYKLALGCPDVSVSTSPSGSTTHGTQVVITASAPGCANPQYEFWILSPGASLYTLVQAYGSGATLIWSTGSDGAGVYRINVWVRDASSAGKYGNAYGTWDAYHAGSTIYLS